MKHYVYVIQCGNKHHSPIKIGMTANPQSRVKELQTGCPYLLTLKASIPCESREYARKLERFFHRRLRKHQLEGEWFKSDRVNFAKELSVWESIKGDSLSLEKDHAYGNSGELSKLEKLTKENKKLRHDNRKLKQDIEEYLDAQIEC